MTTPPNDPFNQNQPEGQQPGGQPPQYGQQPDFGHTGGQPQYGQQPQAGQPQYGQQPGSDYTQQFGAFNPGQQAAAAAPQPELQPEDRGSFFSALFDFQFSKLVATRVIPVLYMVVTIIFTISAVVALISGVVTSFAMMGDSVGLGLVSLIAVLIFVPLIYLVYLIIARILLELYLQIFRISQHTARIAENTAK